MAMIVAVKEGLGDAFPHCSNSITEVSGNSRTTIFQCTNQPFESQVSLQNIHLDLYTEKDFNRHPAGGKETHFWHRETVLRKCIDG